jgi:ABC-type branched-subunit amino acid transport system substrate-binding protein
MKRILNFVLTVFALATTASAQPKRYKVAIVAPLYLDSAFDAANNYRFNTSFPKYLNAGLEFYLGAQAALDSLNKAGAPLDVSIVDSRSRRGLAVELQQPGVSDAELLISNSNAGETRMLADEALRRKVPFVSATLPNDAGVSANPYYVVLNATLRTHCETLYKYYQRTAPNDKIILFTRPGAQEMQVRDYFLDFAKSANGTQLKIQVEDLGPEFDENRVVSVLDSTRRNICLTGSLDEDFASELAAGLTSAGAAYKIQLAGMPTWEGINFRTTEFRGLDIIYTTPFYYAKPTLLQTAIAKDFTAKQNGRPTDLYYRGYETVLRFTLLLLDSKGDIASNLSRKGNTVFTPFSIQPVFLNNTHPELDYFENKHLYFVKVVNGVRSL